MALEQFKTQVLILHSEQSTLDNLSSGIDDRYTVHCATSGTEALVTLGETPIHVIVSAQDLPGMSGVEALREAKKRSPETIGILLASGDGKSAEALVGDKEVFRVVNGSITGEELGRLVDNATRQMRLLALAESANDTAANPDEPAEHIIMETSENGSTIISDGTGQVPILDPKKISASEAAGAHAVDVLVMTKDEEFLSTVRESTRGMHNVRHANTLAQAEAAIAKNRVGVAVVDAAMVGANLEKLTQHLRRKADRLVNIVAGRRDDGEMLMDLINRGKVYRFLLKPVSPGRARLAIEASVKHHLEAPAAAFAVTGATGKPAAAKAQPAPKPVQKPSPKAVPKAAPTKAAAPPQKQPESRSVQKSAKPARQAPTPPSRAAKPDTEPMSVSVDDGLTSAFGGDDSSFTETMTGIVTKFGEKFSPDRKSGKAGKPESTEEAPLAADESGGGSLKPGVIGMGVMLLVAVAAGGYWLFGGTDEITAPGEPTSIVDTGTAPAATDDDPVVESPTGTATTGELLDEARRALREGRIVSPDRNNAVELFAAAAKASPNDAGIRAELDAAIDEAIATAEVALLERRPADAELVLNRVAAADANNARLPFLRAQLSQIQLRNYLDQARSAIRDQRFEVAADAIASADSLTVADRSEIDVVSAELDAARSEQRVEDVLARAANRLDRGDLISPPNDSARHYYQLVLSNDPGNTVAAQGLSTIASRLVLQARSEIDSGSFDRAERLLADARSLDADSPELAATTRALADARDRVTAEARQREAAAREAEQQAEREREEAERRAAAEREAEAARAAAAAEDAAAETPAETAAADDAATPTDGAADDTDAAATAQAAAVDDTPIPISSLTRVKYVAPKYPRSAERRNISGWVDVIFIVATDGTTKEIEILDSDPGDTFVNAATRAIERWEFEPVVEDGQSVEKRAGVRLMFALE